MDRPLSPIAASLRSMLLQSADANRAIDVANVVVDQVNEAINDAGASIATSLLTRALIARAIIAVAADWWHDVSSQPVPVTHEAIMNLVQDLPPEFDGASFIDPTIAAANTP